MPLSVDQDHVGIMMVYVVFISSTIFEMSSLNFSSKPPVYGRLGLILSGGVVYRIVINLVALS